MTFISQSI